MSKLAFRSEKVKSVKVPGSCGELVQGIIGDSLSLVTCPVALFSTVTWEKGLPVTFLPYKAQRAVELFLAQNSVKLPRGRIRLRSELLKGKGMSSSSADIAAAVRLAAEICQKNCSETYLSSLAAQIEPTDGVFCEGIVHFDHRRGKILAHLGMPPPLNILIFDCGGKVNTVLFNQRQDLAALNEKKRPQVKKAFAAVRCGLLHGDGEAIGYGATLSAFANQEILPKPALPAFWRLVKAWQGLGVCAAHSGTLLGAIFPAAAHFSGRDFCLEVEERCPALKYVARTKLMAGGFFCD